MLLIAESGSTKTDWMLMDEKGTQFTTIGFNPNFHGQEDILNALNQHKALNQIKHLISELFFLWCGMFKPSIDQYCRNSAF